MSAAAGVLKRAFAPTSGLSDDELAAPPAGGSIDPSTYGPEFSLVEQLFLGSSQTRRVLFATVGVNGRASLLCEQIGRQLVEMAQVSVALIESCRPNTEGSSAESRAIEASPDSSRNVDHHLHLLPPSVLNHRPCRESKTELDSLGFAYLLLACDINDGLLPVFCRHCDGAVLVLTANSTRRDAAVRAQQLLQQRGVRLLGSMLDGREFPIPDSIYNRL